MKTIDKIIKFIFRIGVKLILLLGGTMLYIWTLIMLIYMSITKRADFMKEFNDINENAIDTIKTYII